MPPATDLHDPDVDSRDGGRPQRMPFKARRRGPVRTWQLSNAPTHRGRVAAHLSDDCPSLARTNPDRLTDTVVPSMRQFALDLRTRGWKACQLCAAEPLFDWALSRPATSSSRRWMVTSQKPAWAYERYGRTFQPSRRASDGLSDCLDAVARRLELPRTDSQAGTIVWGHMDDDALAALANMSFVHPLPDRPVTASHIVVFAALWTTAAPTVDAADVSLFWDAAAAVG